MFLADGKTAIELPVVKVGFCEFTDVVFLGLGGLPAPPAFDEWVLPKVDLFAPPVGSRIGALGYHSAEITHLDHQNRSVGIRREVAISCGTVIDIHEHRRDASHLNFPCFQTDARFDGGMSGGPVFNEAGRLCGIIADELPPGLDPGPRVSYVTTLAFMAATVIDFGRVGSTKEEVVLQLMLDRVIDTRGHEFVKVERDEAGRMTVSLISGQGVWIPGR